MRHLLMTSAVALALSGCATSHMPASTDSYALTTVTSPVQLTEYAHRDDSARARDEYRHPQQTLSFFELSPEQTVVEIWPGGGWYTDILAPYLRDQGQLIAAHWHPESPVGFFKRLRGQFEDDFLTQPELYGNIQLTVLEPPKHLTLAADNSADRVLTFRNVHNWMRNGQEQAVFNAAFAALKPGGLFGVVEHRAPNSFSREQMVDSGYVSEDYVIELATAAGFELVGRSEVNANALDNKDHPKGVWTLPPSLRLGDKDKAKYLAIGESDRMTLKFRKPECDSRTDGCQW
ncbi:methyltransferase [Bacterioplanes sanyensis]|uniref:Methyltransferase n=1 Tax=Bacterioplanes sanyensis TaxID=1249553 RepID=A0A222FI44_9GAMM|nr:class I SAM-dependent methyltransferase [Bacterioplanes sanyensis]ASP38658.1 methyltransferase [Bacterioplanes sanyensis]